MDGVHGGGGSGVRVRVCVYDCICSHQYNNMTFLLEIYTYNLS